jgi:hypothetical protein
LDTILRYADEVSDALGDAEDEEPFGERCSSHGFYYETDCHAPFRKTHRSMYDPRVNHSLVCGVFFDVGCAVGTRWNAEAAVRYFKGAQSATLWGVQRCDQDRAGKTLQDYRRFPAHVYACVRVSTMKRWETLQAFLEKGFPAGLRVRLLHGLDRGGYDLVLEVVDGAGVLPTGARLPVDCKTHKHGNAPEEEQRRQHQRLFCESARREVGCRRAGSWPWCDDDRAPLACRPSPFGSYDHCCIIHLQGGGHTDYTCGEGGGASRL